MKRKRTNSNSWVIILVIVCLALAIGFFFKDYLINMAFPKPSPTISPLISPSVSTSPEVMTLPPPSIIPSPSISPTPKPSVTPVVIVVPAIKNISAARKLLKAGEIVKAIKLLEETLTWNIPDKVRDTAQKLMHNAGALLRILAEIRVSPAVQDGKLVAITLDNGGVIEGVILKEDAKKVVIQNSGGIEITLQRAEIMSIKPLDISKFLEVKRAILAKIIRSAKRNKKGEWLPWFKALKYARKFELHPEIFDIFSDIIDIWPDFSQKLADYDAYRLYRRALNYFSRGMVNSAQKTAADLIAKFPTSRYVRPAEELVAIITTGEPLAVASRDPEPSSTRRPTATRSPGGSSTKPTGTPRPSSTKKPAKAERSRVLKPPKAVNDKIAKANLCYEKARRQINKAFEHLDSDDFDSAVKCFEDAVSLLRESLEVYETMQALNPEDQYLEAFIEQVYKLIYLANKSKPLGVW